MRRRKRTGIILLGVIMLSLLTVSGIYGFSEKKVTNHLQTGVVLLELKQYEQDTEGKIRPLQKKKEVLPGMEVSQIPRIYNKGDPCYIRFRVETTAGERENILPPENILGISDQFVERNGYYYYKNVLEGEAYAEAFQAIQIPKEWDEETRESIGGEFEVRIEADAIQSSHITPDFDREYPWGEAQDIQKHRDGAMCRAKYVKAEEGPELTILFEDGSDKLFVKPEDFFSGFPKVLPGDVYEEMIHLKNSGNYDETLYFKMDVEKEKMEQAEWDLLQKIVLKVVKKPSKGENAETILYQGALGGSVKRTEPMEYTRILDMKKNSQEELVFSLDIPKELDNVFSDRNVKIHWYFSLKDHEKLVERKGVQTGDDAKIIFWCVGCGMSLGILGCILLTKKRKEGLR